VPRGWSVAWRGTADRLDTEGEATPARRRA
jgi:hypothetical protein